MTTSSEDTDFPSTHSVTHLIQQLKEQDIQAAEQIWQRYFQRLLPLARAKLKALPHQATDEEDILVSVFDRFFQAAQEDRFARLHDRDDLWQILLMLTEREVAEQYRRAAAQKRGGETRTHQESHLSAADIRELADREPGPEFLAAFNENLSRALAGLEEAATREVALLRLEGYRNREIAARLKISLRTVERKMKVIREVWDEEFA